MSPFVQACLKPPRASVTQVSEAYVLSVFPSACGSSIPRKRSFLEFQSTAPGVRTREGRRHGLARIQKPPEKGPVSPGATRSVAREPRGGTPRRGAREAALPFTREPSTRPSQIPKKKSTQASARATH
ncbi:hypothetical protein HPB48_019657 [Haemaphysalis longicornis]|uniref:Uncharacterized protein n=1 Tax=Haemaphysalis longicornis TaxID=44386 RepID=A0A9J6G388_HAELO|nr:hypothetical protein HPB48_019657 [Haemaphysalis longicornis]